jgi:hypothetical protein
LSALTRLADMLERGPVFRAPKPCPLPVLRVAQRLSIMNDIREMTDRVPVNESLAALLKRLSADEHDTLMDCLASDVNSLQAQIQALTGRNHLTGADIRKLILRWRMTVGIADDPGKPVAGYAPKRPVEREQTRPAPGPLMRRGSPGTSTSGRDARPA